MSRQYVNTSWYRVEALRPKLKAHLKLTRHRYWGGGWYVIEDPAAGKVHRFTPAAWLFVGRLDGARTVAEAWEEAAKALGEDAPTQGDILRLLGQLHGADLITGERPPDVSELLDRHRKQSRQLFKSNLLGPLSLRLPLFDPDRLLAATVFLFRPFIGWFGLLLFVAFVAPAVVLAGQHWSELTENVSDRVLSADNLILMGLIYPVMKIIHELGHGYVAKAYGASVREFGVMFLVFFPVPYVDASAASALPSKYQRAAVSAAGIVAEVLMASAAFYLWLSMEPGIARAVAFNVMAIGGFSTVVVNGNPLLRFDGYFILSDLLEVPNLANRANRFLGHLVDRYGFGVEKAEPYEAGPWEKALFVLYAPAAFAYRIVMMIGIAGFVAAKFFVLGVVLAIWSMIMTIGWPAGKGLWHVFVAASMRRDRRRAVAVTLGVMAGVAALLFLVPAPYMSTTQGVVWLPETAYVRTDTDGFLADLPVKAGARVASGVQLASLELPAFAARMESQAWRVREMEQKLQQARTKDTVTVQIVEEELKEAVGRMEREREIARAMTVASGAAGRFLPEGAIADMPGRYLQKGGLVGYVVPDRAAVVRVVVGQDQIDLVRGSLVSVELMAAGDRAAYAARVLREVPAAQFALPSPALALVNGGPFATDPRDADSLTALGRLFQFDVALPRALSREAFGSRVAVRFRYEDKPVGVQIFRWARRALLSQFGT